VPLLVCNTGRRFLNQGLQLEIPYAYVSAHTLGRDLLNDIRILLAFVLERHQLNVHPLQKAEEAFHQLLDVLLESLPAVVVFVGELLQVWHVHFDESDEFMADKTGAELQALHYTVNQLGFFENLNALLL